MKSCRRHGDGFYWRLANLLNHMCFLVIIWNQIFQGPGMGMMSGPPGPLSSGKIYPPNQPMVFNPSNPNAPPIYPCGGCHKEVSIIPAWPKQILANSCMRPTAFLRSWKPRKAQHTISYLMRMSWVQARFLETFSYSPRQIWLRRLWGIWLDPDEFRIK